MLPKFLQLLNSLFNSYILVNVNHLLMADDYGITYINNVLKTAISNVQYFVLQNEATAIYGESETEYAFFNCKNSLKTFKISEGSKLQEIQQYAFYQCTALHTVDLRNCTLLITIGNSAFKECSALATIFLPESFNVNKENPIREEIAKKPITPIAVTVTRKAVPPPATVPKLQSLRLGSKLLDFDFNIWDIQEKDLMNLSYDLFNLMEITKTFNAKEDELDHFISRCMQGFRTNPFHNFRRANAGLQLICAILKKAQHKLPPFEEAAVILASYLHDIDHPGTTNTFQIRTSSQLALTYNDKSVLEQNSASFGAKIIQEVFSFTLGDADFSLLRTSFINNVLKTDYTKVEKFLTKIANVPINWESAEFRALVAQVLTLMSDLSFAVRKWKQAEYWYDLMRDEQYQQGEMERRHGMKSEPNYDKRQKRSNTDIIVGHFKVFVIPIFQAGLRFFPEFETQIMSTIQLNYETITAVLEAEQEAEKMANEQKATEEKPKEN